ncbi:unnamed protein product [Eruca vesicaria subsp. sativa]|uniref:Uncharacterized protein n=1 Tax=Eruca vesicaria subsp. sativa TaxID=29727 RepID=A0ABC8JVX6_ERUVS|nr:unnamed protein product [Eruca vesicaria subsp. sativa]
MLGCWNERNARLLEWNEMLVVSLGSLTNDKRKGKAGVEEERYDEAPEELESFSYCSKKGGSCLKRIIASRNQIF